ncbi:NfeD family protein [Oleiharenicola lentus]|uniref:NfeD family protein n=1 Tax=Oleiharenicola lentus TaxID=2508720 RepID=UPI003F670B20
MFKLVGILVTLALSSLIVFAADAPKTGALGVSADLTKKKTSVYVLPVHDEINSPTLYIVRRGLKEAIEQKVDVVLLDMNTPGGALDVTFDIMEALEKFPGQTITFVNTDAISAGAFISATTDEIWFNPRGKIGAAAPVTGDGKDIDKSMRQKIVSFLRAEVRSVSEGKGYRGQVISAMIDEDYELKIGEKILKPKGELLTLTATEALETHGDPAQVLLGAGKASDVAALLTAKFGAGNYEVKHFEVTWSEHLAKYLTRISPILLGLGILALYVEFKTPGFGLFGVTGIVLLAIVFLGSYVAGLSGHEPMLLFAVGVLLVALEIAFFPGGVVFAVTGLALMLGSLVWGMADLWPNEPLSIAWSGDAFVGPVQNLGFGLLFAVVFALALARFLPKGWFFTQLAVGQAIAGSAQNAGVAPELGARASSLVGRTGVAVTGLFPSGQIEIDGRRYEARMEVGAVPPGTTVVVRRKTDFNLIVERAEAAL